VRLLLDENLSYRICSDLRAAGHDAAHVNDVGLASSDDAGAIATLTPDRVRVRPLPVGKGDRM
jgi:predicted nuclease of predicted toxin-antitoxin system